MLLPSDASAHWAHTCPVSRAQDSTEASGLGSVLWSSCFPHLYWGLRDLESGAAGSQSETGGLRAVGILAVAELAWTQVLCSCPSALSPSY